MGFVAAVSEEEKIVIPKPDIPDSDSDEDLFAPGVMAAFGKTVDDAKSKEPEKTYSLGGGGQAWGKSGWTDKDSSWVEKRDQTWDGAPKSSWADFSAKNPT